MNIKDKVYKYKTKYKEGFLNSEISSLLSELNIKQTDFNKGVGVFTCTMKKSKIITYHEDVYKGIICAIQKKEILWD